MAGEDESEAIKHEIDLVIKDRVPKIASRKNLDCKTRAALQHRLLQTENRTYLWLHLTLDSVEKAFGLATPQKMRVFIDEIPGTIYQAYEAMLLGCPQLELARKMLHIVLAAVRPLTLREMNMLFNIERGQKSREEVDLYPEDAFGTYVKNLCGLLVRVFDSKIFLLHQTVKEFLLPRAVTTRSIKHIDSGNAWKHSMEPEESNLVLASRCLHYLSFTIFEERPLTFCWDEDFCELPSTCRMGDHGDCLHYTSLHWVEHFRLAKQEQSLIELWYSFCDKESRRFTTWYESWSEQEPDHFPPLILASAFGHDAIVKQLLEQGVEVDCRNRSGITPLISAARYGHENVVSSLIKAGASLEARNNKLITPLALAAKYGHEHVVRVLIKEGALLEASSRFTDGPLTLAARRVHVGVIQILLEAGTSIEARSSRHYTPLMEAAYAGWYLAVKELLNSGAQKAARSRNGETASMLAASGGYSNVVELLSEPEGRSSQEPTMRRRIEAE